MISTHTHTPLPNEPAPATLPNHVALATRCEVMRLMTDNKVTSKRNVDTGFVLDETREARASAPSESKINQKIN